MCQIISKGNYNFIWYLQEHRHDRTNRIIQSFSSDSTKSSSVTVTYVWLTSYAARIPWRRPPVTSSSHLNLARRVPLTGAAGVAGDGGGVKPRWAGRSTITQVTKIDGKWADTACPRRHQLPRPDGHWRAFRPTHTYTF